MRILYNISTFPLCCVSHCAAGYTATRCILSPVEDTHISSSGFCPACGKAHSPPLTLSGLCPSISGQAESRPFKGSFDTPLRVCSPDYRHGINPRRLTPSLYRDSEDNEKLSKLQLSRIEKREVVVALLKHIIFSYRHAEFQRNIMASPQTVRVAVSLRVYM